MRDPRSSPSQESSEEWRERISLGREEIGNLWSILRKMMKLLIESSFC